MTFANPVRAFEFTLYIGVIPNRKGLFKTPLLLMLIPKLSPSYIFLNSTIGKKYNWLSCGDSTSLKNRTCNGLLNKELPETDFQLFLKSNSGTFLS